MRWTTSLLACVSDRRLVGRARPTSRRRKLADAFAEEDRPRPADGRARNRRKPRPTTVHAGRSQFVSAVQAPAICCRSASREPAIDDDRRRAGVSGRAVVDLDVVRQKKSSGGWFDPTSYLTGQLPVTASGRASSRGTARAASSSSAPKSAAFRFRRSFLAGDGLFLHALGRQPEGRRHRRRVRAARRRSARIDVGQGNAHRSCSTHVSSMAERRPADAACSI